MEKTFPNQARVVVIGGGIVGCATAYHLARLGCEDVVLVEQFQLTAGSTWHAAGATGQLRSNANVTRLLKESLKLYSELEAETGVATGWVENGSLRLACTKDRRAEYEIAATTARSFGIDFHMISPDEVKKMVPRMNVDDLECAAFVPSDGVVNPSDITQALAKGARNKGVAIFERTKVEDILVENGMVTGVVTDRGTVRCEIVVNCCGIWAPHIGRLAGVNIPLQPSYHQFLVTEEIAGLVRNFPTIRDTDNLTYFKEEVGGLAVGGYEFEPLPFLFDPIPDGHEFKLMPENIDFFEPLMTAACGRFPDLETVGVKQWFNGIEAFTEDGMFILGEAPEVVNYFVGAGFNAFGIAAGGGAGMALAHWILDGEPPFDLWAADIRRFGSFHRSSKQVCERSLEGQGQHYAMHWPHHENLAGRPLRMSPTYHRLKENGACFGSKMGWERANWFAPKGVEPKDDYSFGRQNWFEHVGREHQACREAVALFDQSSFAKFKMVGADAEQTLQKICGANIAQAVNQAIYTQILNEHGGIESDITVTRLAEDEFYIVTGTGYVTHDFHSIVRHIPDDADARLLDVTSGYGCLALMGPLARDVLSEVSEGELDNQTFPHGTGQHLYVAGAPVYSLRVAFVGELGWEIYVPSEYMVRVYDALKSSGEAHGLRDCGYRAIDSLRLEKARRVWSHDIGPDYTPLEAGLGFAVDLTKDDFIGKDAILRQKQEGVKKRLASFVVDDPDVVLYGKETLYRNGEHVGWLTSAGFGHTIGKPIGLGYVHHPDGVDQEFLKSGEYEMEVRTRRVPTTLHMRPVYDPENERVNL